MNTIWPVRTGGIPGSMQSDLLLARLGIVASRVAEDVRVRSCRYGTVPSNVSHAPGQIGSPLLSLASFSIDVRCCVRSSPGRAGPDIVLKRSVSVSNDLYRVVPEMLHTTRVDKLRSPRSAH